MNATHGHSQCVGGVDGGLDRGSTIIPRSSSASASAAKTKPTSTRFTKEIAPLILTGPPGVTGFAGGRPKVEEIMAYFPALIPKSLIETKVDIVEA